MSSSRLRHPLRQGRVGRVEAGEGALQALPDTIGEPHGFLGEEGIEGLGDDGADLLVGQVLGVAPASYTSSQSP